MTDPIHCYLDESGDPHFPAGDPGKSTHYVLAAVVVTEPKGGTKVRVSIGVGDDESASEVCRRVHDAVAAYLEQQGEDASEISVKVSHIG